DLGDRHEGGRLHLHAQNSGRLVVTGLLDRLTKRRVNRPGSTERARVQRGAQLRREVGSRMRELTWREVMVRDAFVAYSTVAHDGLTDRELWLEAPSGSERSDILASACG